ncbi:MAG: nucleotidyltransferase domain-containing protein [Candidatus Aminicenantales bacterium]
MKGQREMKVIGGKNESDKTLPHPDYKPIIDKTIDFIKQHFKKDVLACALFGSVARGTATPHSDIDLFIVHRKSPKDMVREFSHVVKRLRQTEEYRSRIAQGFIPEPYPVFVDKEKLKKHPWILLDILDHGIILFDRSDILKRELKRLRKRLRELGAYKVVLPDKSWYWVLKPDWKPGEIIQL